MKLGWISAAALLFATAIWAQGNAPAPAAPPKIGTINLQTAIIGTAEGKRASSEIQSQFAARSTELQNLQKQIEDLRAKLQAGQTLSDQERERIQREGERLSRLFQRKQQYFQDDLNAAQQEVANNIGRKLLDVLNKYAKEQGYSVILDTSSQQTPVIYGATQIDVTQEITRLYDQTYPAKPAAAKPAPAPKP